MKLETSIKPRKDGTVIARVEGVMYVFAEDANGVMVAEVEDESHAAYLLARSEDFMPAEAEDFEAANALIARSQADDEEDVPPDDEPDMNAPPIEEPASVVANPEPAKGAKVSTRARRKGGK